MVILYSVVNAGFLILGIVHVIYWHFAHLMGVVVHNSTTHDLIIAICRLLRVIGGATARV